MGELMISSSGEQTDKAPDCWSGRVARKEPAYVPSSVQLYHLGKLGEAVVLDVRLELLRLNWGRWPTLGWA